MEMLLTPEKALLVLCLDRSLSRLALFAQLSPLLGRIVLSAKGPPLRGLRIPVF